jgi:hypothetical protein
VYLTHPHPRNTPQVKEGVIILKTSVTFQASSPIFLKREKELEFSIILQSDVPTIRPSELLNKFEFRD